MNHKRLVAGLAVAAASVFVLSACSQGNSTGNSSDSSKKVTLNYALWDPNEQVGYQKSIDEFEKLNPNIHVNIEQTAYGDYWTKLTTEFAAGDAPDVFWDQVPRFPDMQKEGVLLDLSPYIKKDNVDTSIYYPQLLKAYQKDGGTYGLPKDWDTIALVYNKKLVSAAGVNLDSGLTWNPDGSGTFISALQKLTVDNSGVHPNQPGFDASKVKQYGFVSLNDENEIYWNYIAGAGGTVADGSGFTYANAKSQQGLQFAVDLISKYHVSPSAAETNPPKSAVQEQMFQAGQAAVIQAGDWNLSQIVSQSKFPVGIAKLPAGPAGSVSVFNGLSDAVYAKTKYPAQAWKLEQWLASSTSEKILGSGGYVWPGITSLDSTYLDSWKAKSVDVTPYLNAAHGKTIGYPVLGGFTAADQKVSNVFNEMFLGHETVAAAAKQADDQANAAIQAASH
jgi:multiple sugar transport system substrate-binding protein